MSPQPRSSHMSGRRTLTAALATLTAAGLLTACGTADGTEDVIRPEGRKDTGINIGPDQNRIRGKKVDAIAAQVPAAVRERGTLRLGASADASPPLGFYATDDRTRIGSEIDLATLIADTLGLKPRFEQVSWENLFVGLDSIAFEARKGSGWKVEGPADVAGKTISVASGTNQEKILVDWSEENVEAGREPVDIKYFQKDTDYYLALQSGRIDAYLGPSPSANYHVASAGQSEIIGTLSGAGDGVQGKIAVTTKKDSGLVKAYGAAIDHIIQDGSYADVLERWGLSNEAV